MISELFAEIDALIAERHQLQTELALQSDELDSEHARRVDAEHERKLPYAQAKPEFRRSSEVTQDDVNAAVDELQELASQLERLNGAGIESHSKAQSAGVVVRTFLIEGASHPEAIRQRHVEVKLKIAEIVDTTEATPRRRSR